MSELPRLPRAEGSVHEDLSVRGPHKAPLGPHGVLSKLQGRSSAVSRERRAQCKVWEHHRSDLFTWNPSIWAKKLEPKSPMTT